GPPADHKQEAKRRHCPDAIMASVPRKWAARHGPSSPNYPASEPQPTALHSLATILLSGPVDPARGRSLPLATGVPVVHRPAEGRASDGDPIRRGLPRG